MQTNVFVTLEHVACCRCGAVFGIESSHTRKLRENHALFYCPNGHSQYFPQETEAERLKRETQRLARALEYKEADLKRERDNRERAERSASAYKGQATKIRNRVGRGVCPCCNRSFGNLHHHMKTQHPDWVNQDPAASAT